MSDNVPDRTPGEAPVETAEALFERIQRRRAATPATTPATTPAITPIVTPAAMRAPASAQVPGATPANPHAAGRTEAVQAARVDEILAPPAPPHGSFPRSATMRLLLKHPELALGVGLPAAGVILGFPQSRRLLGAALRLGARADVQQALQLTSVLRQRGRRRSRSDPESD